MENFSIPLEMQGKRLDSFLAHTYPQKSRSFLAKKIREGAVLLNNTTTKPKTLLKKGDSVSFSHAIFWENTESVLPNANLFLPILFENEHFLIINKPAGIQVHPSTSERKNTVVNWLLAQFPEIKDVGEDNTRPGIVHRIDKDTSGVMVISKTQESFEALKELFSNRNIQKEYLAIVHGVPLSEKGDIDLLIARSRSFRKQVVVRDRTSYKGQPRKALTQYETLQILSCSEKGKGDGKIDKALLYPPYSILCVRPKTGRMHQIRVHLSAIGYPIVGDTLYARKEYPNPPHTQRFLLHAHKLSFSLFGKEYSFIAPIPQDVQSFKKSLISP